MTDLAYTPAEMAAFRTGLETALETVRETFAAEPDDVFTGDEVAAIIQRSLECASAVMGELT